MRLRAAALLALAMALAAAAGCGSSGNRDGDYVDALNQAQTALARRFGDLQRRMAATSSAQQDAKTLGAYEAAVRQTVAQLREVDPPGALAPLHQRFIGEVAGYETALRTARRELRGDDPQAILAAQGRLRTAVAQAGTRLNATIDAINRKLED
jgi:hypothetical protein